MTKEESKKIIDENAAMAVACTYNVLFTNDIVSGLALDAVESEAFVRGAEWLADYLCKIPFDKIIQELHSYVKEKSDRREAHDEHK